MARRLIVTLMVVGYFGVWLSAEILWAHRAEQEERVIIPKPGTDKKPIRRERETWVPPPAPKEEPKEKRIPYSTGKEKYACEVLIRFTSGLSIPRGPHKREAGPYELGISKWGETEGMITGPSSIKVDRFENIYVLDLVNRRILKYSSRGKFLKMIKLSERHGAGDFDIDTEGNIYTLGFPHGFKKEQRKHLCELAGISTHDVSIFFVEKYDSVGKSAGISYFPFLHKWAVENSFWPQKILVDDKGYLHISEKVFKFTALELLELYKTYEGIFSPTSGEFYSIKKDIQEIQILKGKEKLESIGSINLTRQLEGVEFIKEDANENIYLCCKFEKTKEIWKINRDGEVVVSICNLPYSDACKFVATVSENDDIYLLIYWLGSVYKENHTVELIKWYKEEG
ncbi:MAG: hypothetical protein U9R01_05580 [candidate division WOR-3 bacterium]|nr:hypothetical protein [candidate division WOR-3 bacterium]